MESEEGKGTTMRLIIPYKIAPNDPDILQSPESSIKTNDSFKSKIILVAEDNEINQTLIKHLFKVWQLNFDLAHNGAEVIKKLQLKRYDLILMDIQMPEMDGYTATQEIRNGLKSDTPIIAMTAHAFHGGRKRKMFKLWNERIYFETTKGRRIV